MFPPPVPQIIVPLSFVTSWEWADSQSWFSMVVSIRQDLGKFIPIFLSSVLGFFRKAISSVGFDSQKCRWNGSSLMSFDRAEKSMIIVGIYYEGVEVGLVLLGWSSRITEWHLI